jgi:hypothetical protein
MISDQPPAKATDDKQEWTYTIATQKDSWLLWFTSDSCVRLICDEASVKNIIETHNAELTAERQLQISGFYEEKLPSYSQGSPIHELQELATADEVNRLVAQFATERQRREQAERMLDLAGGQNWGIDNLKNLDELHGTVIKLRNKVVELDQQLLSALAAIEKHNEEFKDHPPCLLIKTVDLSALREHDEKLTSEARKPLVDALEEMIADYKNPLRDYAVAKRAIDALAKVKQ